MLILRPGPQPAVESIPWRRVVGALFASRVLRVLTALGVLVGWAGFRLATAPT